MPAQPKGRRKPVLSDSSETSSSSEDDPSDGEPAAAPGRAPVAASANKQQQQQQQQQQQRKKARPSLALPLSKPTTPKNAAGLLIRKAANAGRRLSAVVSGPGAGGLVDGVEGASRESMEEMSLKFEEWMKMATDNKITVNNTWKFALIDYFADLTLLRNGPNDDSINFQKASCTLDGCVKIWTSRVDSVATETGKLLSGLTETGNGEDGDENGEGGSDGDDGEDEAGKKKRKTARNTNTLAPSFASLSTKKLDLEFSVDPLFKKTSADFDEGGAGGLLMNHLGVDGKGKLVFDAGDAGLDDEEDDDEDDVEGALDGGKKAVDTRVAIDTLKAKFLPFLAGNPDELLARPISTTLKTFAFSSAAGSGVPDFDLSLLNLAAPSSAVPNGGDGDAKPADDYDYGGMGGQEDFFADDGAAGGDDGHDFSGGFRGPSFHDASGSNAGDDENVSHDNGGFSMTSVGFGTYNPSLQPSGKDLILAMRGEDADDDDAAGMFGYFDRQLVARNWAGPEHWKVRRAVVGGALFGGQAGEKKDGTAKTSRKAAEPFLIDFEAEETPDYDALFAEGSKAVLTLPSHRKAAPTSAGKKRKSKAKEDRERELAKERDKYLLPQDLHFSSQQLLRLFTKKLYTLRMRKQERARPEDIQGDGEVDEQFWAQAAAEQANAVGGQDDDGMGFDSHDPAPFGTQFFNDDDEQGGGFDGGLDPDASIGSIPPLDELMAMDEENLWAGTQDLKRTRPDYVKYTKRAKRVDVKKLKDSIWKGLEIFAPPIEGEEDDDEPMTPPPEGEFAEPRVFSSVVDSLQKVYPSDKLSDLSTSYCFICLLHLCNERGLQIETARAPGDVRIAGIDDEDDAPPARGLVRDKEPVVGQLGWLKISKDVNAKGHA